MYTLSSWAASNSGWWKCFRSRFGQCTGCCWRVLWRVSQWHSAQVIKRTHRKRSSWLWLDICGISEAFEVPRPTVRSCPTSHMSHYPVQLKYPTHMYARVSHNDQHKQWPCFIANMHTKKNPIKGQCYWPVGSQFVRVSERKRLVTQPRVILACGGIFASKYRALETIQPAEATFPTCEIGVHLLITSYEKLLHLPNHVAGDPSVSIILLHRRAQLGWIWAAHSCSLSKMLHISALLFFSWSSGHFLVSNSCKD